MEHVFLYECITEFSNGETLSTSYCIFAVVQYDKSIAH